MQLHFEKLPLVEAAVRLTLGTELKLSYALVNHLASQLHADFPILSELDQLEPAPGLASFEISPGQLTGARLQGNSDGMIISIQNHLVSCRWLRQKREGAPQYPRYEKLRSALWKAVEVIQSFPPFQGALRPSVANMVYVNVIPYDQNVSPLKYFASNVRAAILESATLLHEVMFSWRIEQDVDLRLHLQNALQSNGGQPVPCLRLASAGGIILADSASASEALDRVHDQLQEMFLSILSAEAKADWQFREAESAESS